MSPQYSVLLIVLGVIAIALVVAIVRYPRTIKEYWQRSCMGRAWKQTFPQASAEEIRQFLYTFVDAFAFPRRRALQFAPTDRVLSIYSALYPLKGSPDATELETLALQLEGRYALDLRKIWREDLTLGEIFSRTDTPMA
jgi:propanediol dehydratase small subunit